MLGLLSRSSYNSAPLYRLYPYNVAQYEVILFVSVRSAEQCNGVLFHKTKALKTPDQTTYFHKILPRWAIKGVNQVGLTFKMRRSKVEVASCPPVTTKSRTQSQTYSCTKFMLNKPEGQIYLPSHSRPLSY